MPFKYENKKIDAIVMSAVLHEVYSYVEDGKNVWEKAILEAFSTLAEGGVLLIRDFAAPAINEQVEISFLNDDVKNFYNYFRINFRTFKTWDRNESEKIRDKRVSVLEDFPEILENQNSTNLSFGFAAEMMLHYKNYLADLNSGAISSFPDSWKEIDERYFIPDSRLESFIPRVQG